MIQNSFGRILYGQDGRYLYILEWEMVHEHHSCHTDQKEVSHAHCAVSQGSIRFGRKLKIVGSSFLAILALSWLPGLETFHDSLLSYLSLIWWAVLLGLFLGGVIDYFVPDGFIYSYLGKRSKRTLLYATFAGFLLSACSHGILAIAIQLYKKGASIPAVVTFLLASPWANLPVTILLFGFFGVGALWIVSGAMLVAITTGSVFMMLEKAGLIESSPVPSRLDATEWVNIKQFSFRNSVTGVTRGAVNLANMVLWWIIIGFLIAAVIRTWVPHDWLMDYFGPDLMGLLLTLGVATVIEVCSEGSSPIAFEIYNAVGTLGNPFVFLMAGVVTDYTEIGLLWANIGKRTAIWLPVVTVPQVLLLAVLLNNL
jgi:uncharacterized membrane protein YraQ (UPF0718 family)